MILTDFGRALGQLGDPRFRRVLGLGVGLTLMLLVAVYALFLGLVDWIVPERIGLPGGGEVRWLDDLVSLGSILLMLFLSIFLMVPVASAFTGLFLDDVAAAVEARHYPGLAPAPRLSWGEVLRDSAGFLAVLFGVNVLAIALYFVVGPFAPVLFWIVNGYLLGREYFQMVAMRRLGRAGATAMRRRHAGRVWLAGTLMAVPLSVPVVNLLVPVLGVATFTHQFYRLRPADPSG